MYSPTVYSPFASPYCGIYCNLIVVFTVISELCIHLVYQLLTDNSKQFIHQHQRHSCLSTLTSLLSQSCYQVAVPSPSHCTLFTTTNLNCSLTDVYSLTPVSMLPHRCLITDTGLTLQYLLINTSVTSPFWNHQHNYLYHHYLCVVTILFPRPSLHITVVGFCLWLWTDRSLVDRLQ